MFRRPFQAPGLAVLHEDRLELIPVVGSPITVILADIVAVKEVKWFNGTRLWFKIGYVMDLANGQRVGVAVAEVFARRWRARLSRGVLPETALEASRPPSSGLSHFFAGRSWYVGIIVGLALVAGLIAWGIWERGATDRYETVERFSVDTSAEMQTEQGKRTARVTTYDGKNAFPVQQKLLREVADRLEAADYRWDQLTLAIHYFVNPDLAQCSIEGLRKSEDTAVHSEAPVELFDALSGGLDIRHTGRGLWTVRGSGDLTNVNFTVDTAAEMKPKQESVSTLRKAFQYLHDRTKSQPAAGKTSQLESLSEADRVRAVALFNDIEDFGHEFDAAFTSRNLAAAETGTRRLLSLLTNFNAAVKGTGYEFSPGIFDDLAKVREALREGDWDKVRQAARHNDAYAREFKRISARMVELARQQRSALGDSSSPVVEKVLPGKGDEHKRSIDGAR